MTRVEQAAERKTARAVPEAPDGELLGSEAAELVALEVAELLLPDAWVCAAHPRESAPQAESGQQEPEWGSQVGKP